MIPRFLSAAVLSITVIAGLAPRLVQAADTPCPMVLSDRIPPRPNDAMGGAAFIERLEGLAAVEREAAIVNEILSGNLPDFLRKLVPVELSDPTGPPQRRNVRATVCVMPDFLAIGSDSDFVRMPMDLASSTRVAREFGFILPTRKMVRAIHRQASHRFRPEPMTPGAQMASPGYYKAHNSAIRKQRAADAVPLGVLVAGHKKTIVLTNRLHDRPKRIAIFGWIRRDGNAIQPLSTVHGAAYADYSHGVRLISETVLIDGQTRSIYAVLDDKRLAGILSLEGPLRDLRGLMGWPAAQ